MAVRTQTQTLFGRISDWGVQTEAPRTTKVPTFWDGLSADEKKASVDQQRSWAFNGQYAWSPANKVCETWNTVVYPNILKPLLKDNGKKIYHKIKKQSPYSVTCWMIGREWHSSHPAAVVICANAKVTKQAVKLVEKHGGLFNWGFRVYGFESKIALNMGSPYDALGVELKDTINLCGQQFQVGSAEGKRLSRVATMGGTVIVGGEIYGLTVVHPFLKTYDEGDSSNEEESNNDDDSVGSDFASNHSDAGNPETMIEADTAYYPSDSKELGSIPRERSFYSLESDWALVRLNNLDKSKLLLNSLILKDTVAFPSKASSGHSDRPLWAAVGTGPPVETTASDTKCGLYVPTFGFQDVWALKMAPG
ncbi:hypothetical protein N7474_009857 [Penicillium riverlandense]|uniref:uncharacterized protein n=1 Tax=Penicillium riverlandense TaxID=1903569 RepID=UPI0025467463|nr:uncharacterized protein N7474_009857 [Penicillium riverlandense]KAJ5808588.1 hypothetical protein N7474_009857 [Penicillium riverlandense]